MPALNKKEKCDLISFVSQYNLTFNEIHSPKSNYKSPLHFACRVSFVPLLKLLLQNQANIEQKDEFGRTAILQIAAEGTFYGIGYKIVKMLIHSGADVDAMDDFKNTSLQYVAKSFSPSIIQLLIQNGADPSYCHPDSNLKRSAIAIICRFNTYHWRKQKYDAIINGLKRRRRNILNFRLRLNDIATMHVTKNQNKRSRIRRMSRKRKYEQMINEEANIVHHGYSINLICLMLEFVFGTSEIRCIMNCFPKRTQCQHDKYKESLYKLKMSLHVNDTAGDKNIK